jgi:hypothetical protein
MFVIQLRSRFEPSKWRALAITSFRTRSFTIAIGCSDRKWGCLTNGRCLVILAWRIWGWAEILSELAAVILQSIDIDLHCSGHFEGLTLIVLLDWTFWFSKSSRQGLMPLQFRQLPMFAQLLVRRVKSPESPRFLFIWSHSSTGCSTKCRKWWWLRFRRSFFHERNCPLAHKVSLDTESSQDIGKVVTVEELNQFDTNQFFSNDSRIWTQPNITCENYRSSQIGSHRYIWTSWWWYTKHSDHCIRNRKSDKCVIVRETISCPNACVTIAKRRCECSANHSDNCFWKSTNTNSRTWRVDCRSGWSWRYWDWQSSNSGPPSVTSESPIHCSQWWWTRRWSIRIRINQIRSRRIHSGNQPNGVASLIPSWDLLKIVIDGRRLFSGPRRGKSAVFGVHSTAK